MVLLASSYTSQCKHFYTLENLLLPRALGLNTFNQPWTYQVSYVFPPALIFLVLCKILVEHVTGQHRLLILVAPCWMEAPWLHRGLNMLEDIFQCCPVMKDLIVYVLVGQVLKGLPCLHLTLWLLRDMYCTDKISFTQSFRQWCGQLKNLQWKSNSNFGKNG